MAVFRVEKTGNYTIVGNYYLRDKSLTLKAKGLLSVILSLPENWDYTLKGLAFICKEGIDAIREAVRELEASGYMTRSRVRNEKGQLTNAEYVIYEQPQLLGQAAHMNARQSISMAQPAQARPALESPILENPMLDIPVLDNSAQINPVSQKIYINKTLSEPNPYPSNPYPIMPERISAASSRASVRSVGDVENEVRNRIGYDVLKDEYGCEQMNEIVGIITEVLCARSAVIAVAGGIFPTELVQKRFMALNSSHITYLFDSLKKTGTEVRKPVSYLKTCLFNAASSLSNHIDAMIRHKDYRKDERARAAAEIEREEQAMEELLEAMNHESIRNQGNAAYDMDSLGSDHPADCRLDADRLLTYSAG